MDTSRQNLEAMIDKEHLHSTFVQMHKHHLNIWVLSRTSGYHASLKNLVLHIILIVLQFVLVGLLGTTLREDANYLHALKDQLPPYSAVYVSVVPPDSNAQPGDRGTYKPLIDTSVFHHFTIDATDEVDLAYITCGVLLVLLRITMVRHWIKQVCFSSHWLYRMNLYIKLVMINLVTLLMAGFMLTANHIIAILLYFMVLTAMEQLDQWICLDHIDLPQLSNDEIHLSTVHQLIVAFSILVTLASPVLALLCF